MMQWAAKWAPKLAIWGHATYVEPEGTYIYFFQAYSPCLFVFFVTFLFLSFCSSFFFVSFYIIYYSLLLFTFLYSLVFLLVYSLLLPLFPLFFICFFLSYIYSLNNLRNYIQCTYVRRNICLFRGTTGAVETQ